MLTEEAFSEKNADYNDKFGGNIRMFDGFLRVAAATPDIRVADVPFNTKQICSAIEEAQNNQAKIVL